MALIDHFKTILNFFPIIVDYIQKFFNPKYEISIHYVIDYKKRKQGILVLYK